MNDNRSGAASDDRSSVVGMSTAVGTFLLFGICPLYWAQLAHVPALEVIWHRILWGGALAWTVVIVRRRRRSPNLSGGSGSTVQSLFPRGRMLPILIGNGVLLSSNWLIYVWAVSSGRTLEASLGYYINPLVSVLFGMVFFSERLRPLQWVSVGSATVGVAYMTLRFGTLPWVSLALAVSFGLYGVAKKRTSLSSIHSLAVELTLVMFLAAVMVIRGVVTGNGSFFAGSPGTTMLLLGTSVGYGVAASPLWYRRAADSPRRCGFPAVSRTHADVYNRHNDFRRSAGVEPPHRVHIRLVRSRYLHV